MNRRITQVAVAAAAAMALSLAAPVSAQAGESGSAGVATPQPARQGSSATSLQTEREVSTAASNVVTVSSLRLGRRYASDHLVSKTAKVSSAIAVAGTFEPGYSVSQFTADLYVSGKRRGAVSFSPYASSVSWPRAYGYGATQLRNLRATVSSSAGVQTVPIGTASNGIRVRREINQRLQMKYSKRGSKMTVRALRWRVYQPNGSTASVRKVKLQRFSKGKWRNYKNIKLNKSGNGKITYKSKKKYKYRLYVKTSTTVLGARTYSSAKV